MLLLAALQPITTNPIACLQLAAVYVLLAYPA